MKPIYFLLAGALAFTACNSTVNTADNTPKATAGQQQTSASGNIKIISSAEAKTLLENQNDVVVVDVRTPEEYAGGHVKNALLINKYDADFESRIKALDREKPYLIYCASGGRSGETRQLMEQMGFKQVYDAKGFEGLKNAGIPVEK
jgi:phage shock protein E